MFFLFVAIVGAMGQVPRLEDIQPFFNESQYPTSNAEWNFEFNFVSSISSENSLFDDLSSNCKQDLQYTIAAIAGKLSSLKQKNLQSKFVFPLIDSWAKLPPPGLLRGNVKVQGQFVECRSVEYYAPLLKRKIQGELYRVFFDSKFRPHTAPGACGLQFSADICLPKSCAKDVLTSLFQSKSSSICHVSSINQYKTANAATWVSVAFMSLMTIACLVCSLADYYLVEQENIKMNQVLTSLIRTFSFHRNVSEIFTVTRVNQQTGCLNCIRVLSISWVVAGHALMMSAMFANNVLDLYEYASTKMLSTFYVNAYYSVDSFFFMSGLVLALSFFKALKQHSNMLSQPKTWIMFYVHRFVRLSPSYYFSVFFYGFVVFALIWDMPLYIRPGPVDNVCSRNWKWNILYINNFVHGSSDEICYGPSWYLSVDFQLYLLSPVLLLAFAIFGTFVGLAVSIGLCAIAAGLSVFFVLDMNFPPQGFSPGWKHHYSSDKYNFWIYNFPFVRMQPYVIGIALGYLMLKNRTMRIPKVLNVILWIVSLGTMLGLVLLGYTWTNGTSTTLAASAAFNGLGRLAWSLCLAWIVVACYYQQGGPVAAFMNWHIWIPLARLSYSVYLTHIGIIILSWGLGTQLWQFRNGFEFFIMTVCLLLLYNFVFSIYWTAVFEKPFVKLEGLLFAIPKRKEVVKEHIEVDTDAKRNWE